jgi:SAM-dependent methyltransferase
MRFSKSLLRREEYKVLSELTIDGKILDIGGSKKSGYHELIKGNHTYTVSNINESYGVDELFDAQERWPFDSNYFDGVLFINVLEHIYDYRAALGEAARVLKDGGRMVAVVPFMFNIHGSPNDFYRYTESALRNMLAEAGFSSCEIRPLGTGAFSVIYHCLLGFVRWAWLANILIPVFKGADRLMLWVRPNNPMSAKHMPLGYYVEARTAG